MSKPNNWKVCIRSFLLSQPQLNQHIISTLTVVWFDIKMIVKTIHPHPTGVTPNCLPSKKATQKRLLNKGYLKKATQKRLLKKGYINKKATLKINLFP